MRDARSIRRRVAVAAASAGLSAMLLLPGCACRCRKESPPPSAGTTVTGTFPMSKGTPGVDNAAGAPSSGSPAEGRAVPIGKIPKAGDAPAASPRDGKPNP